MSRVVTMIRRDEPVSFELDADMRAVYERLGARLRLFRKAATLMRPMTEFTCPRCLKPHGDMHVC